MMKRLFFMRQKWISLSLIVGVWGFFHWSHPWDWVSLITACFWLWIHRRNHLVWRDTSRSTGEILLSPIDGRLVKIGEFQDPETGAQFTELRIQTAYYHNWGLYLPSSAEMDFLRQTEGSRFTRAEFPTLSWDKIEKTTRTEVVLKSTSGHSTRLCFPLSLNNKAPHIWMKSGDRGRGAACFGYYPFGGSLIVFVPKASDVLVVPNERITAGRTVLAVFRPLNENTEDSYGL